MARRSPWIDEHAEMLVGLLRGVHGLELPIDAAREQISDHLDYVAKMMRIGRQAAKVYVTEDVICGMASRLATAVDRHESAIDSGDVACLDQKRRKRFPRP